jgi:hypothetical protein
MAVVTSTQASSLADILERVLDKGIVIAGDITIALADVDLLKIRIRLLIASVDKAEQIGINWWRTDPAFGSSDEIHRLREENNLLRRRLEQMERQIALLGVPPLSAPPAAQDE